MHFSGLRVKLELVLFNKNLYALLVSLVLLTPIQILNNLTKKH